MVDAVTDVTPLGRDQGLLESTAQQFRDERASSPSVTGAESLRPPGTTQVSFAYTSRTSALHFRRKRWSCTKASSPGNGLQVLDALPIGCREGPAYSRMGCCSAVASLACSGIRAGASAPLSASPASGRPAVPCRLAAWMMLRVPQQQARTEPRLKLKVQATSRWLGGCLWAGRRRKWTT